MDTINIKQDNLRVCRLCLKILNETDGEELNSININMLKVLSVELPFTLKNELILCPLCSERLQNCFTFKIMCLNSDNHVKALHNCEVTHPVNLEKILPNHTFVHGEVKNEGSKICRLCLKQCVMGNFLELSQMDEDIFFKDLISRSFSAMDFSLSLEPVICSLCMESVQNLFNFIIGCFDANEMIKNYISSIECHNIKQVDLIEVHDFMSTLRTTTENNCDLSHIKVEKDDWNVDDIVEEEMVNPDSSNETVFDEGDKHVNGESGKLFCVELKRIKQNRTYSCYHCPYKTSTKATLILHFLIHKSCSEISVFKCDLCSFETKWRTSLRTHLLLHKDKSELQMYKCANCKYQSMFKKHLRRHMQIHGSKKYSCDDCSYSTKTSYNFKNHLQNCHDIKIIKVDCVDEPKNAVKIKKGYKCTHCSYETTKSCRIKEHIVKHMSKKDVPTFQCDMCSFQTKYKASLSHHKKIHQRKKDAKTKKALKLPSE